MKGCVCVTGVSVYEGVCVCDRCVCVPVLFLKG